MAAALKRSKLIRLGDARISYLILLQILAESDNMELKDCHNSVWEIRVR